MHGEAPDLVGVHSLCVDSRLGTAARRPRPLSAHNNLDSRNDSVTKQHSFDREELLACSRGELFGPGNA